MHKESGESACNDAPRRGGQGKLACGCLDTPAGPWRSVQASWRGCAPPRMCPLAPASRSLGPALLTLQVEVEDMDWSEELQAFTYQCPCGDLFQITLEELAAGEEVAKCPSCSLYVRVM